VAAISTDAIFRDRVAYRTRAHYSPYPGYPAIVSRFVEYNVGQGFIVNQLVLRARRLHPPKGR